MLFTLMVLTHTLLRVLLAMWSISWCIHSWSSSGYIPSIPDPLRLNCSYRSLGSFISNLAQLLVIPLAKCVEFCSDRNHFDTLKKCSHYDISALPTSLLYSACAHECLSKFPVYTNTRILHTPDFVPKDLQPSIPPRGLPIQLRAGLVVRVYYDLLKVNRRILSLVALIRSEDYNFSLSTLR